MKTLADLRAALVVGSRWHLLNTPKYGTGAWTPGVRTLAHVQSNSFAFENPLTLKLSWCDFPKKTQVELDDRKFTITHEGGTLCYTREDRWLEDSQVVQP